MEPVRSKQICVLGEQSDESFIHAIQRGSANMKIGKKLHHATSYHVI
jgi:hypothetical protein